MSSSSHVLVGAVHTTKDYNLAASQQLPVQMDSKGNVKVTGSNITPALANYVYVTDGTHTQPTLDAAARAGYIYVTDGTHTQPTLDAAARAGYIYVTDGTHTQPTLDAAARAGYIYVTDGTHTQPTLDDKTRAGYIYLTDGSQVADINENNALKVVLTPTPKPMTAAAVEADADRSFVITLKFLLTSKNVVYNMLYFSNPLGSGKDVYLRKLSTSNVTSSNLFNVTMHTNPTVVSLGTAITINNAKIGSATASVCRAYNGNTVTSSDGTDFASVSGSGEQNALDFDYGVILRPNNSLLFNASAFDNNQTILINLIFTEITN